MPLDILRLIQMAPSATRLAAALKQAQNGDAEARAYLLREGWADALEVLVPGGKEIGLKVGGEIGSFIAGRQTIEGEYREIYDPLPWESFVKQTFHQRSGGHIIMGQPGSGKTTLAIKLAYQWYRHLNYKVECAGMYLDDVPDFASIIDIDTLIKRMKRLQRYLKSLAVADEEDEDAEQEEAPESSAATPPPGERVVIIDEASMNMGNTATDPGRRAALQALAQSRHLGWHVLYLAQWAGQLPLPLLGQSVCWVKKPAGDEKDTDRDNRRVRELWEAAEMTFAKLPSSHYYTAPHNDWRAWAYVEAKAINGARPFTGLVPYTPYAGEASYGEQTG